jgi:uncharacterized cupin superfamily protein
MSRVSYRVSLALNVVLAVLVGTVVVQGATHAPAPSKEVVSRDLKPLAVNPEWIKSGQPRFMASETLSMPAYGISTGLWSCDGPAVFDWTFGTDETVHILDGEVEVHYLGNVLVLTEGDTAFFRAGTKAEWRVKERVFKSFVLQDPGRLGRLYRKITGA